MFTSESSMSGSISWRTVFSTLITDHKITVWFDHADGDYVFVEATDNTHLFLRPQMTNYWGNVMVEKAEINITYALT